MKFPHISVPARNIRAYENLHIPLWLIKDTAWMLEWKTMGVGMIPPTLFMAFFIAWKTRKDPDFYINVAVCCWILANAYWMCCEFFGFAHLKDMAGIPFALGMVSVAFFYLRKPPVTTES